MVHITGAHVTEPKSVRWNKGNVPYKLTLRGNTIVRELGDWKPAKCAVMAKKVEFQKVLENTNLLSM